MNLPLGPGNMNQPIRKPVRGAEGMCDTIGSAIERAMVEGRKTHESLARDMGVSRGYLSLIISGKRKANVLHVLRAVRATGSLVPVQWVCRQVGGELYVDEKKAQAAILRARADELDSEAA